MNVICMAGEKRSGKDTACILATELLTEAGYKVQRVALADAMKEITSKVLSVGLDDVETLKDDEDIMIGEIIYSEGPVYTEPFTNMRGVLQRLGEHLKVYFGKNVWFDLACQKITEEKTVYIITDIRFPFELDNFVTKFNAWSIKIERDTDLDTDNHESEKFIKDIETSHIIDNNSSMEKFKENLRDILLSESYL